jgi:hypothetical protein
VRYLRKKARKNSLEESGFFKENVIHSIRKDNADHSIVHARYSFVSSTRLISEGWICSEHEKGTEKSRNPIHSENPHFQDKGKKDLHLS